jgi:gluconokinase
VFLDLPHEVAQARVASRSSHFFSASLVDSQFATLESPVGEPGVLRVDATEPPDLLLSRVNDWLESTPPPTGS